MGVYEREGFASIEIASLVEADIAATETWLLRRFENELNEARQRAAGVTHYIWRSADDSKVRSSHAERDDRVFPWDHSFPDGLPGEDTASILMEGTDGLIATADGCICAPGYPDLHGDRLEVIGTKGTIVMDYDTVSIVGDDSSIVTVDLLGRYQECFDIAVANFVAGVTNGTRFETDRLDNLETLRLMESVYRAAGVEIA